MVALSAVSQYSPFSLNEYVVNESRMKCESANVLPVVLDLITETSIRDLQMISHQLSHPHTTTCASNSNHWGRFHGGDGAVAPTTKRDAPEAFDYLRFYIQP